MNATAPTLAGRALRVAVLSAAHVHAASYVRLLESRADTEVVLADPDGYGDVPAERTVATIDEAWTAFNGEAPDAVVVCSDNAGHKALVLEAARRGIHVLCEKPLATTVEDAEEMVDACANASVVLMTAFPVHFSPQVAALRQAVDNGSLGEIIALAGANNGKLPAGRDWFTDPEAAGGGALVDHVVHLAEILDSLFGEPETVHAVANGVLYGHTNDGDAETGGLVTLRYANGLIATIDCSWSQPAEAPTWGGLKLHVAGTGGQLEIDAFSQRVDGPGQWHPFGFNLDALLLDAFLEAVRSGETQEPSGAVGARTVRVVDAAQESVRTGRPVPLR